jgi:hypothetical protein
MEEGYFPWDCVSGPVLEGLLVSIIPSCVPFSYQVLGQDRSPGQQVFPFFSCMAVSLYLFLSAEVFYCVCVWVVARE